MKSRVSYVAVVLIAALASWQCQAGKIDPDLPAITYIQYESPNLLNPAETLNIGGQLRVPASGSEPLPAVVILHGSAGVDSRGALYARALNDAGIATLEIDMWGARGITSAAERPPLPTVTLPDAFGALQYLAALPGIDAQKIGVLGFSWGGVMSLLSADKNYTSAYGNGLQFAAHVAHYPVCWAYNIGIPGIVFNDLTGAPVLMQVGDLDDYDEGGAPCQNLAAPYPEVSVTVYPNAHHGWDRLQPALTVQDPFSHLGQGGEVNIVPNPGKANQSSKRVVREFVDAFGLKGK